MFRDFARKYKAGSGFMLRNTSVASRVTDCELNIIAASAITSASPTSPLLHSSSLGLTVPVKLTKDQRIQQFIDVRIAFR